MPSKPTNLQTKPQRPCSLLRLLSELRIKKPTNPPNHNHRPDEPQQPFPLMRLPSELRNKIYQYAISTHLDAIKPFMDALFVHREQLLPKEIRHFSRYLGALGLLHADRQIRMESAHAMQRIAESESEYLLDCYKTLRDKVNRESFGTDGMPERDLEQLMRLESLEYQAQETRMVELLLSLRVA
jgi:hypothetical protein